MLTLEVFASIALKQYFKMEITRLIKSIPFILTKIFFIAFINVNFILLDSLFPILYIYIFLNTLLNQTNIKEFENMSFLRRSKIFILLLCLTCVCAIFLIKNYEETEPDESNGYGTNEKTAVVIRREESLMNYIELYPEILNCRSEHSKKWKATKSEGPIEMLKGRNGNMEYSRPAPNVTQDKPVLRGKYIFITTFLIS